MQARSPGSGHWSQNGATMSAEASLKVDARESRLLELLGPRAQSAGLDVGDAHLSAGEGGPLWVFERKTLADFRASVVDGRWTEQHSRLLAARRAGARVCYVVEGLRCASQLLAPGGDPLDRAVATCLAVLALRDGVPVLFTSDTRATADVLLDALRRLEEQPDKYCGDGPSAPTLAALKARRSCAMTPQAMFRQQLLQLPGVGPAAAAAIAERFGAMACLVQELDPLGESRRLQTLAALRVGGGSGRALGRSAARGVEQGVFARGCASAQPP
jgi:ERCC4-type nuclease